MPFGQTFEPHDLIVIALLVVLEGVLSLDNALVLALLSRRLPKFLRGRALTYGLVGAFVFRILAICLAGLLLKWEFPKLLGGLYLLWVAAKYFAGGEHHETPASLDDESDAPISSGKLDFAHASSTHTYAFWMTVVMIELTDIAFAVDSILAAVGLVAPDKPEGLRFHPKLWLVVVGGMLGVVVMRIAAVIFIRLLERFPRFETSAYLLVTAIGSKLVIDYLDGRFGWGLDFHNPHNLAFWIFWAVMLGAIVYGFVPQGGKTDVAERTGHG